MVIPYIKMTRPSLSRKSLQLLLPVVPALFFYAMRNRTMDSWSLPLLREPSLALQNSYDRLTHTFSAFAHDYLSLVNTKKQNSRLVAENRKLRALALKLEEIQLENHRLSEAIGFQAQLDRPSVAARVIGHDILDSQKSVVVNKGRTHGIRRLQAVISPDGVVGTVISVGQWTSRVLLINDRSSNVDATVQRTRARGILSGHTESKVKMKYLMRKDDLKKGDFVVTSGRQGFFPPGFVIGKVEKVFPSPSTVSFEALVEPSVPLHKLEEVLILAETAPSKKLSSPATPGHP